MKSEQISAQIYQAERTAKELRERLDQDTRTLASLDPESDAYDRLQASIDQRANELLDCEERSEHLHHAMQRAQAEEHRSNQETSAVGCGLFLILAGGIGTVIAWGTWWLVLTIILILLGVIGLANYKDM